jgi:hypothetical protein
MYYENKDLKYIQMKKEWTYIPSSPTLALGLDKVTNNPNNVSVLLNRIFHRSRGAYLCATKTKYHLLQGGPGLNETCFRAH